MVLVDITPPPGSRAGDLGGGLHLLFSILFLIFLNNLLFCLNLLFHLNHLNLLFHLNHFRQDSLKLLHLSYIGEYQHRLNIILT